MIIDACAYYCQFYDMNNERLPETMRSIFFNLAQHDEEFRTLLRKVLQESSSENSNLINLIHALFFQDGRLFYPHFINR